MLSLQYPLVHKARVHGTVHSVPLMCDGGGGGGVAKVHV
jgi:hypothetical protein